MNKAMQEECDSQKVASFYKRYGSANDHTKQLKEYMKRDRVVRRRSITLYNGRSVEIAVTFMQ